MPPCCARRVQPRPVTSLRRWTGQLVDALLFAAVAAGVTLLAHVSATALGWPAGSMAVRLADGIGLVAAWVAVFVVPPWQNLAASPGQMAVWLTPIWPVGRAREKAARYVGEQPQAERDALEAARHGSLLRRLGRANVVALPMLLCALVALAWWSWFPLLAWPVLALARWALVHESRTHCSLSGWLTGAEFVDLRSLEGDEAAEEDFGGV